MKNTFWLALLLLPAAAARAADHPCQAHPQGPWAFDETVQYLNELKPLADGATQVLSVEDRNDPVALNGKCSAFDSPGKRQACGILVDWGIVTRSGVRWSDGSGQWKRVRELDGGEVTGRFNNGDAQEVMERVCSAYAERQAAAKAQAQAKASPPVDPNEVSRHAHQLLDEVCHSFGGCLSSGPAPSAAPAAPPAAASPGLTFRDLPQCASNDCTCLCKNAKAACGDQGPTTDRPGCTTQFSNAASCSCW